MNYDLSKILIITLLGSTMSGCSLYSKYQRTESTEPIEELYAHDEADTTNMAQMSWRELFTDAKLQALIERGLERNTDLNVARLSVEQAHAALKSARLAYLPSLSLSADGRVYEYRDATYKSYDLAAGASWEVDIFGKIRNSKEQSIAALEQTEAYCQAIQTELVSTIAGSYYTLIMLDKQLDISRRTERNWVENLRVMEALKRAGRINETAVLQTAAGRVALAGDIEKIERQIKETESSLSTLLGVAVQHIDRGGFESGKIPEKLSVGLPIQLLQNRPDVRAAEANLAKMFYATNVARSSLYPSISLGGSVGFTNSSGAILNPGDMLYEALGSIVQPLFSRGTLRAQLKISESQQQQALLAFNQSLLDAGDEVNRAMIQISSARSQIEIDTNRMALLTEAEAGAKLLMRHGSADYLDVLTAQYTLLQSELSNTANKFDEVQGLVNLYRALGGGDD